MELWFRFCGMWRFSVFFKSWIRVATAGLFGVGGGFSKVYSLCLGSLVCTGFFFSPTLSVDGVCRDVIYGSEKTTCICLCPKWNLEQRLESQGYLIPAIIAVA
jgi:hypothetical protein